MTNSGDATVINDRYQIHKRIGRGGMADVFSARDLLLDRQVAIKVLFPEFAVDPNFVERFRREAQAAANLSHPNIVNVYDWGKFQGTYFIAMEVVQGRTLAEILKTNERLTPMQAAEIASEVAAALGFAHEAHLVHRDIKPANILIGTNGQVKVADFGIARAMNASAESNLTQAGSVMGTASYFSPEQAQGAQPDPRSDLYSLGIVMYEMVAGKPPFTGENPVAIAYKQVHDPPTPLNRIVADVPRPFEAIVAKLLAKDPTLRYPTAQALRDDLRRFRNGEQVQALIAAAARPAPRPTVDPNALTTTVGTTPRPGPAPAAPVVHGLPDTAPPTIVQADVTGLPAGASPEARYYQESSSRTGWYALVAFIALVALVAGGVLLYQKLSQAKDDQNVPRVLDDYTNQSLESVTAALDLLDLPYAAIREPNPLVPEMFVFRTDPPAGSIIADGQVIRLFYNPSKELKKVPNVEGLSIADATRALSAEGFQVGEPITEMTDRVEQGLVIRTDPPAGEPVPLDQLITLIVSGGPDQVAIPPSVIGDEVAVARQLLESNQFGLVVRIVEEESDTVEPGRVIRTNPPVNEMVTRGSTVELIVSTGPGKVFVPPFIGLTEEAARNLAADRLLQLKITLKDLPYGDGRDGTIIEQSVNQGVEVPKGTTIEVAIGVAPDPTTTTSSTTTTTTPPTTATPTTATPTTAEPTSAP